MNYEIQELFKEGMKKNYAKRYALYEEEDTSRSIFLIVSGEVSLILANGMEKEFIFDIKKPGEYFGEVAFLDGKPRCHAAVTRKPCELIKVGPKQGVEYPILYKELTKSIRKNMVRFNILGTRRNMYEKLKYLFESFGCSDPKSSNDWTHNEISNMISSSREMVSIILSELVQSGYISMKRKSIKILKTLPEKW